MLSLTIKIVATFQSSACLSNIQIWGKPSWSVDKKVQKDIQSIWQALITAKSNPSQGTLQSEKKTEQKTTRKRNLTDPDSTPEEFLDALTCKRMYLFC